MENTNLSNMAERQDIATYPAKQIKACKTLDT